MTTEEELQLKVRELEKQVRHLNEQIKNQEYGLNWLDVPEGFETESENKIPILEEVPELAINNHDGKPTHIIIEGDNYHALTCLNYTHHGKIDVIYIDPPYNTGSDGFTYKDKRFLKEYPDGTPVPVNHPLRHSYWLSFMNKRLELAIDLLSEKGIILISIDDNEIGQLKLMCDKIFRNNGIALLPRITKSSGKTTDKIAQNHDYILIYCKDKNKAEINGLRHFDTRI
jgi:adenine-specific DNA-methyltransferase